MASGTYIERDEALIRRPLNKTFEELLAMTELQFRLWAIHMREEVARMWREQSILPLPDSPFKTLRSSFA
jgi:hypothetical protein